MWTQPGHVIKLARSWQQDFDFLPQILIEVFFIAWQGFNRRLYCKKRIPWTSKNIETSTFWGRESRQETFLKRFRLRFTVNYYSGPEYQSSKLKLPCFLFWFTISIIMFNWLSFWFHSWYRLSTVFFDENLSPCLVRYSNKWTSSCLTNVS